MLGIAYLLACSVVGYLLLKKTVPALFKVSQTLSLFNQAIRLPDWVVVLPSSFLIGTLVCTWFVYIVSYLFYPTGAPMLWGNLVFFALFLVLSGWIFYNKRKEYLGRLKSLKVEPKGIIAFLNKNMLEIIYVGVILIVWSFFVFRSFNVSNNTMNVGISVFSDFAPHLSVIRSFSHGMNFPSEYPHFADGTMRYHFMFQFLVGNLEYLGTQIDLAFNLPSIFSMLAFLMLLYAFAVMLFGKRPVGIMAGVLFFFRSSFAFFTFFFNIGFNLTFVPQFSFTFNWDPKFASLGDAVRAVLENRDHIGNTEHEIWGLYAQKVYVNQRHFAFALAILFMILILLYPLFKKMLDAFARTREKVKDEKARYLMELAAFVPATVDAPVDAPVEESKQGDDFSVSTESVGNTDGMERVDQADAGVGAENIPPVVEPVVIDDAGVLPVDGGMLPEQPVADSLPGPEPVKPLKPKKRNLLLMKIGSIMRDMLFSMDSWLPENKVRPVILGLLLGMLAFWNGAVVVIGLAILFVLALFSKHRSEYFVIAVIVTILTILQSAFFAGSGAAVVAPQYTWGYLARDKSLLGVIAFYIELLGILPFIALASLFVLPKGARILSLAFFIPIVVATTLQLTPDVTMNHKYVIMGAILLNIPVSYFLFRLFTSKVVMMKIIAAVLCLFLGCTGIVDIITLFNMDKSAINHQVNDPLREWVEKNTGPNEIFLTDMYSSHAILLAGRKLFYGWPYYPWSAGYDTEPRKIIRKQIYEAKDPEEVKRLIEENAIKYIVVDNDNRSSTDYAVNEDFISKTFKLVYEDKNMPIAIYRTY